MTSAATPQERIALAFSLVLARAPSEAELKVLLASWERQRAEFAANPAAAEELLASGESIRNPDLDPLDHAALTGVCLAILNLDETLSRE